jgi:hypothetical protein
LSVFNSYRSLSEHPETDYSIIEEGSSKMEKRSIERYAIDASAVCGYFSASTDGKNYNSNMINYSADGMCIESSGKFKRGAIVMVKVNTLYNKAGYNSLMEGFRTLSLAEIKWSKPSHDMGKTVFGMSALKY